MSDNSELQLTPPQLGSATFMKQAEAIASLDNQRANLRENFVAPFLKYIAAATRLLVLTDDELQSIQLQYYVASDNHHITDNQYTLNRQAQGLGLPSNARLIRTINPKYKDALGNTWAGRGSKPAWVVEHLANGGALDSLLATKASQPENTAFQASLLSETASTENKLN